VLLWAGALVFSCGRVLPRIACAGPLWLAALAVWFA
jgi:hypothetical protein